MKKSIITMFVTAGIFAFAFTNPMDVKAADTVNKIENGIFIGDVDVSGMTAEEAQEAVSQSVDSLSDIEITFEAMNNNSITKTAKELGISWNNSEVVTEALEYGKKGNVVQRYKSLKDLEFENKVFPVTYAFDEKKIKEAIEVECEEFNVEAQDATLSRENDAFVIKEGVTGVIINVDESVSTVENFLTSEWDGKEASIDLVVDTDEPRGTKEELAKVKDVLGTFTTNFSTSGSNRAGNVENGCSLINGTILYPGDEFSTYEAVSPFTESNGYYMAGSYLNGLVVESLGGGICQVSTTLYNAVLRAELEVTQRSNHSMVVTYVDRAADAAISGTSKDFKFVNNLDYPIYIEGKTSDRKISFTVYGVETRPTNREVVYESKELSRTEPVGEKVVGDGSKPVGFVDIQAAHTGYVAELWKIVKVDGVEESRTLVNKSTYKMSPRTATVGTASGDPNAAAAMNAAVATGSIEYCRAVAATISTDPAQAAAQAAAAQAAAAQTAAAQAAAAQTAPAQ